MKESGIHSSGRLYKDIPPILSPHLQFVYVENLLGYTSSAIDSLEIVHSILKEIQLGNWERQDHLLDHAQNVITQSASISKFFFNNKKGYPIHHLRSKFLRHTFGIDADSPLVNRKVRNVLEHLDEYIDEYYWNQNEARITQFNYVGYQQNNELPHAYFRAYFLDTTQFEILGHKIDIGPLEDEITPMHRKLVEFSKTGRFPNSSDPEFDIDFLKDLWNKFNVS